MSSLSSPSSATGVVIPDDVPKPAGPKVFTAEEVAQHNKNGDLWCIIDGKVFDLSRFASLHPGGLPPLIDASVAGKDATHLFYELHRSSVLEEKKYARLQIGIIAGSSVSSSKAQSKQLTVPYGEAMGTWRKHSPYYTEAHHKFRAALRATWDEIVAPYAKSWDDEGQLPTRETDKQLGDAGMFACLVAGEKGVGALFEKHGIVLPGGIKNEEHDSFMGLIGAEENRRGVRGCYGVADGLTGGMAIGLPPLLKFGSEDIINNFAIPIIKGEKRICLAISEPYAGSDVQQIRTTATPMADGSWCVTGVKKWITGGMMADYFTTLAQTEKHGPVMLLVERGDGTAVSTKPIKTSYSPAAGTAYVEFHNAVVPAKNVIGQVGQGFYQTMANFNFERWGMICSGNFHARMVVEECMKWAMSRKVFGKALIQQPVIRYKMAEMIASVESVHSMLEDITYQMSRMSNKEINKDLAGPIALLKYKQSRVATLVSDNACQIFGGRAITSSGMGYIVEKFQKSFKFQAILGGSEEIMADFAMRQAMRKVQDMPARL